MVAAQSAHVFNQDLAHIAALDVLHNLQKSGPVPACAAPAVIRPMDNIGEAVPGCVFLQVLLLMLNGQGLVFPPVLMAQSLVKDGQLVVVHGSLFPAVRRGGFRCRFHCFTASLSIRRTSLSLMVSLLVLLK